MSVARPARTLAIAIVALTVLAVLLRLPTTLRQLKSDTKRNDGYTAVGRELAAADSLNIDNAFVVAALDTVPPEATYSVVAPSRDVVAAGKLAEITYDALAPYMRYLMLPRRPVAPAAADYILCYGCDVHGLKVRWVWQGDEGSKYPGLRIGRRTGP